MTDRASEALPEVEALARDCPGLHGRFIKLPMFLFRLYLLMTSLLAHS